MELIAAELMKHGAISGRAARHLFDLATKKAEVLTPGTLFDEEAPVSRVIQFEVK